MRRYVLLLCLLCALCLPAAANACLAQWESVGMAYVLPSGSANDFVGPMVVARSDPLEHLANQVFGNFGDRLRIAGVAEDTDELFRDSQEVSPYVGLVYQIQVNGKPAGYIGPLWAPGSDWDVGVTASVTLISAQGISPALRALLGASDGTGSLSIGLTPVGPGVSYSVEW